MAGRLILSDGTTLFYRTGISYEEVARQLEVDKQQIAQGFPVEVGRGHYHPVAARGGALALEEMQGTWIGSITLEGKELLFTA